MDSSISALPPSGWGISFGDSQNLPGAILCNKVGVTPELPANLGHSVRSCWSVRVSGGTALASLSVRARGELREVEGISPWHGWGAGGA